MVKPPAAGKVAATLPEAVLSLPPWLPGETAARRSVMAGVRASYHRRHS